MFKATVERLRCPKRKHENGPLCQGDVTLASGVGTVEIRSGELQCKKCKSKFPILAGVAVLVNDVRAYLIEHVKGVSQIVQDSEIPQAIQREYLAAKDEILIEHIEEDLEAERVVALYLMNHYLGAEEAAKGVESPLIAELIRKHWEQGPFEQIAKWVTELSATSEKLNAVELSCGVGGLYRKLASHCASYLGVDSSFTSVALGRHLALGAAYPAKLRIPRDLLQGPVSVTPSIKAPLMGDGSADLVVGDLMSLPVQRGVWDLSLALNTIDMMPDPRKLPDLQRDLLVSGGRAIQTCPYIWHEVVADDLRSILPREIKDSARAAEWLYEKAGLAVRQRENQVPWLFFKHIRQLEIYSVHMLLAQKA